MSAERPPHDLARDFGRGVAIDLCGCVAIVTGSTRGIGWGIARRLGEAGASVMCNARSAAGTVAELDAARARSPRIAFHAADVSSADGASALVDATLAAFGRLDIVVNNAGVQPSGDWSDAKPASLDETIGANVRSVECMTRAALASLLRSPSAAIVNVASVRAARPGTRMAHYSASKAAVVALTKGLAVELGPKGIRVNAISPGLVDRPGLAESWPEGVARFANDAPLRRIGEPADVASACLFLVSGASSWITGVNLTVDGGISLVR